MAKRVSFDLFLPLPQGFWISSARLAWGRAYDFTHRKKEFVWLDTTAAQGENQNIHGNSIYEFLFVLTIFFHNIEMSDVGFSFPVFWWYI